MAKPLQFKAEKSLKFAHGRRVPVKKAVLMFASDDLAESFYLLDRAMDGDAYHTYLRELSDLLEKLRAAILLNRPKRILSLQREIADRLKVWPVYPSLDITDEHVESRVRELSQTLAVAEQSANPEVRVRAASEALSALQEECAATAHYEQMCDD